MLHLPQTHNYPPMLVPNQQAGKLNYTRSPGMYVTVAPQTSSHIFINSEYDQEIPQSQAANKPMAPRGRATQQS